MEEQPTIEHPVLIGLNTQVSNLKSQNEALSDANARLRDKYRRAEMNLEALLKELLDDESIEVEIAQRIADIFDNITLTKQIEISYTITATTTVEVPYGSDPDEVADSTYVERVDFYTDFDNAEVLETDYEVEGWNVR